MEDLKKIIEELSIDEQNVLSNFIQKIKMRGEKVTELNVIHNILKTDISSHRDGSAFQEMSLMATPPLIKAYHPLEVTSLPNDFLPLSDPFDKVTASRSSVRDYTGEPMDLRELSTLLYVAYGLKRYIAAYNTSRFPVRMSPSSGGLQGTELYLVVNRINGLKQGLYHYHPLSHALELIEEGFLRRKLVHACFGQEFVNNASVVFILSGILDRLRWKYGIRSYRYIHVDSGVVCQSIYLAATALKLGVCAISGFDEDNINRILRISNAESEIVILLMTLGKI